MSLSRYIRYSAVLALAGAALSLTTGCASAVDKNEVVNTANPVKGLHAEIQTKEAAEKNAIKWSSYEDALTAARKDGKFVMVDFYATWCKWCKKLDTETYPDPRVVEALKADFIVVKIDSESSDKVVHEMRQMSKAELATAYEVSSYPAVWFLDKDGKKAKLLKGFLPADDFLVYLKYIKSGAYKTTEFEDYAKKGGGK